MEPSEKNDPIEVARIIGHNGYAKREHRSLLLSAVTDEPALMPRIVNQLRYAIGYTSRVRYMAKVDDLPDRSWQERVIKAKITWKSTSRAEMDAKRAIRALEKFISEIKTVAAQAAQQGDTSEAA